jgi:divalent metal cation (Fe/Co/Zn/Cd) transporter
MSAEGALGLLAGAKAHSISLLGWALGSAIEGLASIIVIWRFTGTRTLSGTAEARAQKAVAVSFFLLAPYIAIEAVRDLVTGNLAATSTLGIVLTASSVLIMPALGLAKKRLGATLNSGATAGEGTQNLLCAAQAGAVLTGMAATAAFGWTWLDPAIALLLAAWALREGTQAWRGEDCC